MIAHQRGAVSRLVGWGPTGLGGVPIIVWAMLVGNAEGVDEGGDDGVVELAHDQQRRT